jgi:SNF2 family DNA or RNA helicase
MHLTAESPRATQPQGIKVILKDHQLAMLKKCQDIEALNKHVGIMKDKPGSGKTYVILSLIYCDMLKKKNGVNIIVVPQNIYIQWEVAIKTYSDHIQYERYITYPDIMSLFHNKTVNKSTNIILTTPLYYTNVIDALYGSKIKIQRIFLDEIDSISNMISRSIPCQTIWLVSASFNLDSGYMFNLVQKYFNNCLNNKPITRQDIVTFLNNQDIYCICSYDFVDAGFPLQEPEYKKIICKSRYIDSIFSSIYYDQYGVISALNALDFTQNEQEAMELLVKDMIDIISNTNISIEDVDKLIKVKMNNGEDIQQLLTRKEEHMKKLKETSNKLDMIKQRLFADEVCLICYDDITEDKMISPCCKNKFCYGCITTWFNSPTNRLKVCPYCKEKYDNKNAWVVIKHNIDEQVIVPEQQEMHTSEPKSKIDTLCDILTSAGEKVMIFSDYNTVFKEIKKELEERGISNIELDGGTINKIHEDIQKYKYGDTRVLMVNSAFYGSGMNLENTTDIIFIHKTKAAMYDKVVGRAQRPGRTTRLKVYQLLYQNEETV